jgi:hypothetical protein
MTNYEDADHPRNQVLKDGKWVDKAQTPGEMTLDAGQYANSTPSDIDKVLAGLWSQQQRILGRINSEQTLINRLTGDALLRDSQGGVRTARDASRIADAEKRVAAATAQVDALQELIDPIDEEFTARGGWTRFYITTGSNPHVHRSMRCSTCRPTTQFGWLTDHSGMDEDEIVALAGDEACTVCYPSAPVADRGAPRQNRLMTPEARAAKEKDDAAKAAKAAKAAVDSIVTASGDPLYSVDHQPFKTERAAEIAACGGLADTIWYDNHPEAGNWYRVAANAEDAIAAKRGITVEELRKVWAKKVGTKVKKDGSPHQWARKGDRLFDGVDAHKRMVAAWERIRDGLAADQVSELAAVEQALDVASGKRRAPRD